MYYMQEKSSQACNLGQTFEFGLAMEPATLNISVRQDCLATGSSSKGGGTRPYAISQLISSKFGVMVNGSPNSLVKKS